MKLFVPLAILAALTLSCSALIPTTPDPVSRAEIDLLRSDLHNLRQEVQSYQRQTQQQFEQQQKLRETSNMVGAVNQDAGEDICNRSPSMQQAILEVLELARCSLATQEELYRIISLEIQSNRPLKKEDFQGLRNLSFLQMTVYDPCGQWDELTFTDSVLAELPALLGFRLDLYRDGIYPGAASAVDIADAAFVAIHNHERTEATEHYSESNQDRMQALYRAESVDVEVHIRTDQELFPCRR